MEQKLTQRRFKGNDNWLGVVAAKSKSYRTQSSRSMRPSDLVLTNTLDRSDTISETSTLRDIFLIVQERCKSSLADQWRRATQSGNDPYVKISLKPDPVEEAPLSFCTLPILGGGSNVAFHAQLDHGEHTFLCGQDINALEHKYLKVEVFDKETGAQDRLIGTAHVILKGLKSMLNETRYQHDMPLYGGADRNYEWSGTVDMSATFEQVASSQLPSVQQESPSGLSLIARLSSNKRKTQGVVKTSIGRIRSTTDAIMLKRMQSGYNAKQLSHDVSQVLRTAAVNATEGKASKSKAHLMQGYVVDFVLFVSLILSGTLFLGCMNVYEVDAQNEHMQATFGTTLSVIDSFRFSIVTVTTVGYGDFSPRTSGGKMFASFMIIFGVSLLARLLSTILDRAAANYEEARLRRITNRRNVTQESMSEFDEDDDGIITEYEFLKTMLLRRGDTDKDVIDAIMRKFDEYDQDGSGEIEVEEIKQLIREKQQHSADDDTDGHTQPAANTRWCTCWKRKQDEDYSQRADTTSNAADCESVQSEEHMEAELAMLQNIQHHKDDETYEYVLTIRVEGCDDLREADELVAAEDSFWSFIQGWFAFMLYLLFGASVFSLVEGANFGDMLWFFVVTTCTVGYGDVYIVSSGGKILNALFISMSVILFVSTFSSTFDYIYARQEALIKQKASKKRSMNDMIRKFPVLAAALHKSELEKKGTVETEKHKSVETQDISVDVPVEPARDVYVD